MTHSLAVQRDSLEETFMRDTLHNWIFICAKAYVEYAFVPWLGRDVYRRTVDLNHIRLL
jgi:hypothetical protein